MTVKSRNVKEFNNTNEIVICSKTREPVFLLQVHHVCMARKDLPCSFQKTRPEDYKCSDACEEQDSSQAVTWPVLCLSPETAVKAAKLVLC